MASRVLNESCSSIATELQEVSPHSHQFLSWDRIPVTDQLPLHSPAPSGWGPDSLPSSCQLPPPQWLDLVPLRLGASIVLMSIRTDNLKLSLHNRDLALSAVTVAWSILHSHWILLEKDQCPFLDTVVMLLASLRKSSLARQVTIAQVLSCPIFFSFQVTFTSWGQKKHHSYIQ